jgi:Flp pilus assembly protein protease CpaA
VASNGFAIAVVAVGVGTCAVIDLKTRRVPNALTAALTAIGLGSAAAGWSGINVKAALIGIAVGFLLMLPGHVVGATGAGDVKLFAATGAVLGPVVVITAFFYTALAGGALALYVAYRRRRLALTVQRTTELIVSGAANVVEIEHPQAHNRFAYVPAIAAGSLIAAIGL